MKRLVLAALVAASLPALASQTYVVPFSGTSSEGFRFGNRAMAGELTFTLAGDGDGTFVTDDVMSFSWTTSPHYTFWDYGDYSRHPKAPQYSIVIDDGAPTKVATGQWMNADSWMVFHDLAFFYGDYEGRSAEGVLSPVSHAPEPETYALLLAGLGLLGARRWRRGAVAIGAVAASASAYAVTAYLVASYPGVSVSGLPVTVCVYDYIGRRFDRAMPLGITCPMSIEVQ